MVLAPLVHMILASSLAAPASIDGVVVTSRGLTVSRSEGQAILRERIEIMARGDGIGGIELEPTLARGAAVTGSTLWQDGALVDGRIKPADQARQRYDALKLPGDGSPAAIGLVSMEASGAVSIDVDLLRPGQRVVLTIDTLAPLELSRGVLELAVPCADDLALNVESDARLDDPRLARGPAALRAPRQGSPETCTVRWPSPIVEGVEASWAVLPLASGDSVVAVEVGLGARLQPPSSQGASIVFVVDLSRSEGADGVAAQLAVVRQLAPQLVGAEVAVVGFARRAQRLTAGFVRAEAVPGALAAVEGQLVPQNGSFATLGLAAAVELLSGRRGPMRIYFLGDLQLPFAHDDDEALELLGRLPAATVVHVIARHGSGGDTALARLDGEGAEPALARVAAAHQGMVVEVKGGGPGQERELAKVVAELVEPQWLDDLVLVAIGARGNSMDVQDDLLGEVEHRGGGDERAGLARDWGGRAIKLVSKRPVAVVLSGRIWGRRLRMLLPIDRGLAAALPALTVGRGDRGLADSDWLALGLEHHLLTVATSFLLARPSLGPSTLGEEPSCGLPSRSFGTSSHCGGFRTHCTGVPSLVGLSEVFRDLLASASQACRARHGKAGEHPRLDIEVMPEEILDVEVVGANPALTTCLEEAVWALTPPAALTSHSNIFVALDP